ncbi:MAG: 7-cyano-7-deazaguanine synthase QueC [Deltaproteobacteria bacterium]|nr:7-cyano-7-deazaguanine synthase QueC [Deltaproteobacteria bacterium]
MDARLAVVLLSGGLDSATVLAMARATGHTCHALSVDYGQQHRTELEAARRLAARLGAVDHKVVRVDLSAFGGSALTDPSLPVPEGEDPEAREAGVIPSTYVPARNTVLLGIALANAEVIGARDLFVGINAVDYSGYPDCRPAFARAFEDLANLATRAGLEGTRFRVQAPLLKMTKAQIVRTGTDLGVPYEETVTCYQADAEGRACGRCDACTLRRRGFEEAGLPDPTRYA